MKKALFTFVFLISLSLGSMSVFANQPTNPAPANIETKESNTDSSFNGILLILLSLSAGISAKRIYEMRRAAFEEIV